MAVSSMFNRASNNSRMRVSTLSGSLRVTMTRGFLTGMGLGPRTWIGSKSQLRRLPNRLSRKPPSAAQIMPRGLRLLNSANHGLLWADQGASPARTGGIVRILAGTISNAAAMHKKPRIVRFLILLCGSLLLGQGSASSAEKLPVPRYVSLKSDRVNMRKGPGIDYPIAWVFRRVGLPVEIIKEYENWRQVRDSEGTEGWVLQNLLSGRRTAIITPWDRGPSKDSTNKPSATPLYASASASGSVQALLEPGVVANVLDCDRAWCRISIAEQHGYVEQSRLWGVYRDEVVR
jgi:SH3-like domain-containing protein